MRNTPDIKFERNAKGEIVIMPPTGGETGIVILNICRFWIWNRQTKLGVCFDSSTCFKLPNGADRSRIPLDKNKKDGMHSLPAKREIPPISRILS